MKIDSYLPEYDISSIYSVSIKSTPEKIFNTIHTLDIGNSRIIRSLFWMRSLYARMDTEQGKQEGLHWFNFDDMIKAGFMILDEERNSETVITVGSRGRENSYLQG